MKKSPYFLFLLLFFSCDSEINMDKMAAQFCTCVEQSNTSSIYQAVEAETDIERDSAGLASYKIQRLRYELTGEMQECLGKRFISKMQEAEQIAMTDSTDYKEAWRNAIESKCGELKGKMKE